MIFKAVSRIWQLEWGKQYEGIIILDSGKFRYSATVLEDFDLSGLPQMRPPIDVQLYDKNRRKIRSEGKIEMIIGNQISEDVTEFFVRLNQREITDGLLGGVSKPKGAEKLIISVSLKP